MKYLDFQKSIDRAVFMGTDVDVVRTGVHQAQFNRWVEKGYITRIRRGMYAFSNALQSIDRRVIAFRLYEPSYVSRESALAYYGLIPEIVPGITSVSMRTTRTFTTPLGLFDYRHVRPALYTGFMHVSTPHGPYLIAEPEKALVDFLYFSPKIVTRDDLASVRINEDVFRGRVSFTKLRAYSEMTNTMRVRNLARILEEEFS